MSVLQGIRSYYPVMGTRGVALLAGVRLWGRPKEVTISVPGVLHPIQVRMRSSDISLVGDILLRKAYEWDLSRAPRVIVDAGANIGLASIYYANRYPEAKIISIEPEPSNAQMMRRNLAYYPNTMALEAALWKDNEPVRLVDPGVGAWGFRTVPGSAGVQGITVDRLMDQYGIEYIDLLKVDIEGAEKEVFGDASRWIDRVGAIVVEPHDRFKVGCSRSLYIATQDFEIEQHKGEVIFLARARKISDRPIR